MAAWSTEVRSIRQWNFYLLIKDVAVDAVGYQATGASGTKEEPNAVLTDMIKVVRACGGLGYVVFTVEWIVLMLSHHSIPGL